MQRFQNVVRTLVSQKVAVARVSRQNESVLWCHKQMSRTGPGPLSSHPRTLDQVLQRSFLFVCLGETSPKVEYAQKTESFTSGSDVYQTFRVYCAAARQITMTVSRARGQCCLRASDITVLLRCPSRLRLVQRSFLHWLGRDWLCLRTTNISFTRRHDKESFVAIGFPRTSSVGPRTILLVW